MISKYFKTAGENAGQHSKTFSSVHWAKFRIMIMVLSLSSVLSYLLVVNHANTMGIEIGEMQLKISRLQDENRDLQNQATLLGAMTRIEDISRNQLSMVPAGTYQYLGEDAGVALNK